MSDLEARRMVRELLRTGLDTEQVLDVVIDELIKLGAYLPNIRVEQSASGGTVIRFLPTNRAPADCSVKLIPGSEAEHAGPPIVVNGEDVEDDV